ncbi:hypothetical protein ACFL2J_04480 [Candidatus Omnitrophota bacterium]
MKRPIILILAVIIVGVTVMVSYYNSNRLDYARYVPKDNLIDLTFEYPQGWEVFERRGAYGAFIQAQVLEVPQVDDKDKERVCSVVITIYPRSQAKFAPLTTQGLADDIKKKRLSLKGSQLLSSSKIKVDGLEATDNKLSYETFKVPLQANAKPIPIIERIVCFSRGDNFYALRLEEMVGSFEGYDKIFNQILKSIQLRG